MVLDGRLLCFVEASSLARSVGVECAILLCHNIHSLLRCVSLSLPLSLADNPIQCSCDTQELWEWLRNHLKLILSPMNRNNDAQLSGSTPGNSLVSLHGRTKQEDEQPQQQPSYGSSSRSGTFFEGRGDSHAGQPTEELLGDEGFPYGSDSEFYASHLQCDQPASLQGNILMDMEPHRFCDAPLILKVAIQDIQPYAVHVSWQTREHSGLHGYHVVYRSMEGDYSHEVSETYSIRSSPSLWLAISRHKSSSGWNCGGFN